MNTQDMRIPRADASQDKSAAKVSGKARYAADIPANGALVGRILRAKIPHARIVSIDVSQALALEGVAAVCTGADCPAPLGGAATEFPLARDKARYRGEAVAAVAARDEATAEQAIRLIRVEYEKLPAYFDAKKAMGEGAEAIHADKPGNILREAHATSGDVEAGFAAAELTREKSIKFGEVNPAQLEPNATLVEVGRDGGLILHAATQAPQDVRACVAQGLGMDEAQIRVENAYVGGGFGARSECAPFEIIAALLARKAKRSVRLKQTREETFLGHRGRPETHVAVKLGMMKDGRFTACQVQTTQTGGAYASRSAADGAAPGLYALHARQHDLLRACANLPPCGGAAGAAESIAGVEALINEMAGELGLDPLAVRALNAPRELADCLEAVKQASGWAERRGQTPKGRGLGLACGRLTEGDDGGVAALALEVSVDEVTGKATAHKLWIAAHVGGALDPRAAESRIRTGVWMGLGRALSEETRYVDGKMLHGNLLDYRMPTLVESPDVEVVVIGAADAAPADASPVDPRTGANWAAGLSAAVMPALMGAVHEAAGVWPHTLPLSPDRVSDLLDARDRVKK
ncbi:Molybdopterin-binding domain of aldehyde dehydrogenase [Rhodoblastus acidophilus]|uniref:Molybdopterin-binding domain of aldehyde dehydrogenase n=1 Tax=Rhodoblastus acidophilus TaxID=1074 RepID=A0A212QZ68_RHOAC|nr:molybdopterin cofactor-binding domain-containing protein [Rhodoblastus acidophilus]SNB65042.1 Molybdopterin-binding domain of aldehyde dehydrogenase [Rhodoblastus acidophilus]